MSIIKRENNSLVLKPLALSIALLSATVATPAFAADTLEEAFTGGKAFANLRLRYESADIDNNNGEDADALTLRTSFGYETGTYKGFSVLVEAEDVREVLSVDEFNVPLGLGDANFDVIADADTTELDQAFLQYNAGGFTTRLGRQVIKLDGLRFVGNVGWRQDHQTFDGINLNYKTDKLELTGAYITQRNRIFAEAGDINSEDIFLNASYKTSFGKFVAYSYLLENDDVIDSDLDTYGVSFAGKKGNFNYAAEFATQDNDLNGADTDYFNIGGGYQLGKVKLSLAYESLGSDSGDGAFQTPLATLHKFNGWADVFLNTPDIGLEDLKVTLDANIAGGKFKLAYHDFSGDVSDTTGSDDLGDEVDIQYTYNFNKHVYGGVKYALYSAGDSINSPVDTERFWVWTGVKFK